MAETEDLKSFQYRFESDRGHSSCINHRTKPQLNQSFKLIMHTHCIQIAQMIRRRQSRAIGLFGPGVVGFERASISSSTHPLDISPKETMLGA